MGVAKEQLEDDGIEVRFDCPNPSYENVVQDHVDGAAFDYSAESAGDGVDSTRTHVTCDECQEQYTVEVVARPGATSYSVVDHEDVEVSVVEHRMHDEDAFDRRPPGQ